MELFPTKGPCAADATDFGIIIISTIWCSDFNNLIMIQAKVPFNFEKLHKKKFSRFLSCYLFTGFAISPIFGVF